MSGFCENLSTKEEIKMAPSQNPENQNDSANDIVHVVSCITFLPRKPLDVSSAIYSCSNYT